MKSSIAVLLFALLLPGTGSAAIPVRMKCLLVAYKDTVHLNGRGDGVIVKGGGEYRWTDGRRYDWKNMKQYYQLLDGTSALEQMFLIPYRGGFSKNAAGQMIFPKPGLNEDPGRIRWEDFFADLYGHRPAEVERDLVAVDWKPEGKRIRFNQKYGAAASLQRVANELGTLIQAKPALKKYTAFPLGGTYNWRPVEGTNRRSIHSYGAAIDINLDHTDYWKWDKAPESKIPHKNRIPAEIADVFERNGFVWGAKWYRYDTMHFEFRPELMMADSTCERLYK